GRREEQLGRVGVSVRLMLEGGQHHPQHREEEQQADEPGQQAEQSLPGRARSPRYRPGRFAGLSHGGRWRGGRGAHAASSFPLKVRKIRRRAKIETTVVIRATTTPIAADWPISKPRNSRW